MAILMHTTKRKVLIPEKVSPDGLELLKDQFDVDEKKGLSAEELKKIIGEYDALIVRSETKVTADLLSAAKKMKVVARAGVGVDNVDVQSATSHVMMAVARNIGDASQSIKAGLWERSRLVGVETKGKTLAIVGLGKVGLTVARIANGLGMRLVAYDPYANPSLAAAASVTLKPSLAEILKEADFLTLHTPLIASTKGMIGKAELESMKPTARILNVARGGMIDEDALFEALDAGTIGGAGIDVFTSEPPEQDSSATRLIAHPKVVATPHLGASTKEAQENVSIDVCEQVVSILSGELPRSAVNAPIVLPDEYRTLQPFISLVEKMGSLYTQHYSSVKKDSFRTTFDLIYEGKLATINTTKPLFAALVKGLLTPITSSDGLNINIVNAELLAKERGILINEQRSRENVEDKPYSSFITLRARASRSVSQQPRSRNVSPSAARSLQQTQDDDQIIQGFVSGNKPFISRLDKFKGEFVPRGTLLICRNFDSVGKIGYVGNLLGKAGVNIKFMNVAPLDEEVEERQNGQTGDSENGMGSQEALMILGVDKPVGEDVLKRLIGEEVMTTAVLAGSTGLVLTHFPTQGSNILTTLLAHPSFSTIHAYTRRPLPNPAGSTKLQPITNSDSSQWPSHYPSSASPPPQAMFSALGTTRAQVGSVEAQRAIDHDLNLSLAQAAKAAGADVYVLVSTNGADANSYFAYPKMKGELEDEVKKLGFKHTVILRPGLIVGDRQESRPAEAAFRAIAKGLKGLASSGKLTDWWAQDAGVIARAAVQAGVRCLEGKREGGVWMVGMGEIVELGKE
ncbi:d-3-phosphoglycerate dehydrogenase [Stemphylium lycopersici]|nr:d-3-phosphoglycerate dehydrogenase [Stemphylium lycopersici]